MRVSDSAWYQRSQNIRRPKLADFTDKIDQWLLEDLDRPKKQHHTVKRIFERLCDEERFTGGYKTVKDYVRAHRRVSREMFIPLVRPPGHGQADFGKAVAMIGGVEQKLLFFAFDLPHSHACSI